MKVYIARHGRTNYNDLELCNADPSVDVHLTELGKQQAEKLAQALKEIPFEKIFVSELPRTHQTANYVNKYHHLEVEIDPRLNDNRTGFESRPYAEYEAALATVPDKWAYVGPGGESMNDVKGRVAQYIDELRGRDEDCVLIVTSMIIVQVFLGNFQNLSNDEIWELEVEQGSYRVLDV